MFVEHVLFTVVLAASIGRKLPIHFLIVYLQNISGLLDKITDEVQELRDTVADSVITTAKSSIEDLRKTLRI